MGRFSPKRLPSPALAVAFVALLAALSGTAIALPGKNTVDSGDLKRGAVKTADIARGAVTGAKVRSRTLTGAKVMDDSLTGAKIDETTLGRVPSASTANSANTANTANSANTANTANSVGGVTMSRIDFRRADVSAEGPVTILNVGGLQLRAQCGPTGDELNVTATTSVNDADLFGYGVDTDLENLVEENEFNIGDVVVVDIDDETDVQQTLSYRTDGGSVVDATFTIHDDFGATSTGCQVAGYATASG